MKFLKLENITKSYNLEPTNFKSFIIDVKKFFVSEKQNNNKIVISDCNLEVEKGDSIALLGKNGAGKSTLLKIIAGITYPDYGSIKRNCTIASMLSILTALEHEFTGYENIFFLGAGMQISKNNLESKVDDILTFADLHEFKNTPVKRYSTGMKVRLSFSICVNVACDLIIADEVLMVSDQAFKEKCILEISKIIEQKKKAIIFVSHDRYLNKKICKYGVVLKNGNLSKIMKIDEAYNYYDLINKKNINN